MSIKSLEKARCGKGFLAVIMAILLVVALAHGNPTTAAEQKVIHLKFSTAYMPFETPNIQANRVMEMVEKKTNGRVKITRFMGGTLGGIHEQLGLVSSGAVDMINLHYDQYPQQLPLHKILNTDQNVSREHALANIIAIMHEIPETKALFEAEQEKNNIKVLYPGCMGVTGVTARIQVKSLADLKGKKLNAITSYQRDFFEELGWIPVNVQIPELYEALSRGVIDAIFMATAAVIPLKWYEVGKAHLILGDAVVFSMPLTFNRDRWNSLPEDIKQAFIEASLDTSHWSIKGDEMMAQKTYGLFKERGVPVIDIGQADKDMFFEAISRHATQDWLKNAKAAGVGDKTGVIQKYWDVMKWGKWKK
jgi:TRAP-type C4-dicarboxylate transport system substrate-binding protein